MHDFLFCGFFFELSFQNINFLNFSPKFIVSFDQNLKTSLKVF